MNNYTENKKVLDNIRSKYGCKGEIIFKSAIQYVIESGTDRLNDEDLVFEWITQIDDRHNKAEAEGKTLWIDRDFEKAIVECAVEIAKVKTTDIIIYLQQEWLFGDWKDMTYDRAIELVKYMVNHILQDGYYEGQEELDDYGITDNELEFLGFGDIIPTYEEEEE